MCVLCADVMCSHVLYVCVRAVRITAECGYVVSLGFCFLFIVCFIFPVIFFFAFFMSRFCGIVCVCCARLCCARARGVLVVCLCCGSVCVCVCERERERALCE